MMRSNQKFAGILLAGSLVSGIGVAGVSAAGAVEPPTPVVTQGRTLPTQRQGSATFGPGLRGLPHHHAPARGLALAGDGVANRQFLPAWGVRLAVKAALQVIKKRSVGVYNQIIGAARAGKSIFLSWHAKAPGWVKAIIPDVAASVLYDAVRWAIGL